MGCFPNRQKPVELSRENGKTLFDWNKVSNRIKAIHLRFDRTLNTFWQSRTRNKNFWKCNGKFRSNWTGRSKRTRRRFPSVPFKRSVYFSTEIYDHFAIVEKYPGSAIKELQSMVAHNRHGKTDNLTAKTKTSRQNQILHSKNKIALVLPWVFALAVRYLAFAVEYLVLPWGFWFCREVFCFCREVFGFAVTVVGHRNNRRHYRWDVDPLENGKSPGTRQHNLMAEETYYL